MQPHSHTEPINAASILGQTEVVLLAGAFAEFVSASASLEASYEKLQHEVSYLSNELAERNAALKLSLAENERVHSALQQIVDSMPCGVLVVERDGSVSMINPECLRLLDLGQSPAQHLDDISIEAGVDLAGFLKRHTGPEQEQEFCKTFASGRRWLAVHDRRLFGDDECKERQASRRHQTILILRDITSHKLAEEERERARKVTALSEVATTLAHEIRNPLASLELFAGLIASGGEGTAEWVSHLHAGIRSLAGTVNNVLSFHGVGFPALHALDLVDAMRSSVEFVRPIADEAGVALLFTSKQDSIKVLGNGSALQQIVLNMVCNAIRHTPSGGSVSVSVRRMRRPGKSAAQLALIEFSDTGCGIAPEHLDDVFRAGFSGSGTSSGLGLAVCSQIVKQHEGAMRVSSKLGIGTTFSVEIPIL